MAAHQRVASATDDALRSLLAELATDTTGAAWAAFLDRYAAHILTVVRLCERDEDHAGDAFVWVAERLAEHNSRRLRRFDPDGTARFETWLGVVVHNLCRDWRRATSGRRRVGALLARLSAFDRAVFGALYERGLSVDRAALALRQTFPGTTRSAVADADDRVRIRLERGPVRRAPELALLLDDPDAGIDPVDVAPTPEAAALDREDRRRLRRALAALPAGERLLLTFRYRHGLTLTEVARAAGLKDPQTADRRLRAIVERLRALLRQDGTAS